MTKKVLLYTHTPRAFRTTLIGYLYEIAQNYQTILLSEKLDTETEAALKDRILFPKLEKIIPVHQITGPRMNLFAKNRYLFKLARDVIKEYKPDIVVLAHDTASIFELYLSRFAKKTTALVISIQPFYTFGPSEISTKFIDLTNAFEKFPCSFLLWFRLFLTKCRKYLGHFLYYWILPLAAKERPFFGKPSFILKSIYPGMGDADYQIVFSKRDYYMYRDTYLKNDVSVEKLYILAHPLARETRELFQKIYFNHYKNNKTNNRIITVMRSSAEIGFRRFNFSLISEKEKQLMEIKILKIISEIMPDWKIYLKPHPVTKNFNQVKIRLESISKNIEVVEPQEPADRYIKIGDVIIGLPLSASATLFTASLQCPEKPVIALDFHREVIGDGYKDSQGIEYIDDEDEFINVLKLIRDGQYHKRSFFSEIDKLKLESSKSREFSNTIEMIEYLSRSKS